MSKIELYYQLRTLEIAEVEFLSSYELAKRRKSHNYHNYSSRDVNAFIHYLNSDSSNYHHGYSGWVVIDTLQSFSKGHVRKNIITTLAISILRLYRGKL